MNNNVWKGTKEEFNNLEKYNNDTVYIIVEENYNE